MNVVRYLLIALTLGPLIFVAVVLCSVLFDPGSSPPPWWVVLTAFAVIGWLILNATYLLLNRPSRERMIPTEPMRGAVNVKALAYLAAACIIVWVAVDIGIKLHEEQRLTYSPSYGRSYRR
jgi:uncharacterized membrane protein YbhN (UPF0104 family)